MGHSFAKSDHPYTTCAGYAPKGETRTPTRQEDVCLCGCAGLSHSRLFHTGGKGSSGCGGGFREEKMEYNLLYATN